MTRGAARDYQSPGLANKAGEAYKSQLNDATGKNMMRRAKNSDDTVVYELMKARPGEQAHHRAILKTLDPLYKGLTDAEAAELTAYLNQYGATGNNILNLINMPQDIHQSGIHEYAIKRGYQFHPNAKPFGMVQDILDASELPLDYRKHVGKQYMTKAVPDMNNYINDLLEKHPSMREKLDMSPVREAQKVEAQAMKDSVMNNIIKQVGRDELRNYDSQVRQNGGDDRQVTINADTVILEKAINGNGKRRK